MPVSGAVITSDEESERKKQELLEKIRERQKQQICQNSVAESNGGPHPEAMREKSIESYKKLIADTMNLALEKLILSDEGCEIFDELCLRVDINQRYAEILPQWKDVAKKLEMDSLQTRWVETCVRPKEGLTRAMLEIYMKDGGTLGEVLEALLLLESLEIIECLRPKIDSYLKNRDRLTQLDNSSGGNNEPSPNYYSILKTLFQVLGNKDPCQDIYKFANGGLKNLASNSELEHTVLIQSGGPGSLNNAANLNLFEDMPMYKSKKDIFDVDSDDLMEDNTMIIKKAPKPKPVCKILLLFSQDGIAASNEAIELANSFSHDLVKLDLFRLNEATLWLEVLTNPEACCMKWTSEADYIMPILTPQYLREIHGNTTDQDAAQGLLPTSPILNRYMYNLARSQYTQNGCKNIKVRPLIPPQIIAEVRNSNAVKMDPLLTHTWIPLTEDKLHNRLRSLVNEFVRKNGIE